MLCVRGELLYAVLTNIKAQKTISKLYLEPYEGTEIQLKETDFLLYAVCVS